MNRSWQKLKRCLWENQCKWTKMESVQTKTELVVTKTESMMTKNELNVTKIAKSCTARVLTITSSYLHIGQSIFHILFVPFITSISMGSRVKIVQPSPFCVYHLVVFLLFFSVIQFSFSLIPTYFLGVIDGRQFRGVDYQSLNRFEIDELTVGEMKREGPHFTRFIPSVGFYRRSFSVLRTRIPRCVLHGLVRS